MFGFLKGDDHDDFQDVRRNTKYLYDTTDRGVCWVLSDNKFLLVVFRVVSVPFKWEKSFLTHLSGVTTWGQVRIEMETHTLLVGTGGQ
jgi:hypothetical protein